MTEKNVFVYKLFFLSFFRFWFIFYVKIAPTPEKSHLPLSQQPPLKVEVMSSSPPPFLKIWLEVQPPSSRKEGGAHYGVWVTRPVQSTQTNKFAISVQYLKENMKDKVDFLPSYKTSKVFSN